MTTTRKAVSVGAVSAIMARLAALFAGVGTLTAVLAIGMVGGAFLIPSGDYGDLPPEAPVRLVAQTIDVKAPIVPIPLEVGVLDPPQDVRTVGWWDASARPGARKGQTVITGHTVHTGGGAMDDIAKLVNGDRVDVITKAGRMRYEVTGTRVYTRQQVSEQAIDLFGQDRGAGRLVLISCSDWNEEAGYYENNVIVFAAPLGTPLVEQEKKRKRNASAR